VYRELADWMARSFGAVSGRTAKSGGPALDAASRCSAISRANG
jgi:hypothetical protein